MPLSSAVALAAIAAFAVFVLIGEGVGSVVLAVGGSALLASAWLSTREPHGPRTSGPVPYPYWIYTTGLVVVGLIWIGLAISTVS